MLRPIGRNQEKAISYAEIMEHRPANPAFGPILRKLRIAAGLTQEELAARLDYNSSAYVSRLELGGKKPSVDLLFAIAAALNIKASEIIAVMENDE